MGVDGVCLLCSFRPAVIEPVSPHVVANQDVVKKSGAER